MLAGQIQSHARGSGDDLYAIRRYHPSDHMRYIDWKATAKSSTMMVREHMREDEWRLTIVFDTALPGGSNSPTIQSDYSRKRTHAAAEESRSTAANLRWKDVRERLQRAVLLA